MSLGFNQDPSLRSVALVAASVGALMTATSAEAAPIGATANIAKVEYGKNPDDLTAERLAETRSNDVLDKYDLIKPSELLDVDGYNSPSAAASCMDRFRTTRYSPNSDPGFVFSKTQSAKRGGMAVKIAFSMFDMQSWSSSDGFLQSCAWYMKEQSVETRLYKQQQPSGKKVLIKQNVASPQGVGTVKASGLSATLQRPGYSGVQLKSPDPEKVKQTLFTDKPIKKGDKYYIGYTIRGKATDAIKNHGHLSKSQKESLQPIKMKSFAPIKIK